METVVHVYTPYISQFVNCSNIIITEDKGEKKEGVEVKIGGCKMRRNID
jgi:hypothetical protein